jgi:hypothetical protein
MKRTGHAGDCTFYASLINQCITDGICTCGYGLQYRDDHDGDQSQMCSKELLDSLDGKMEKTNWPDWQPIETCPLDREVLIWAKRAGCLMIGWIDADRTVGSHWMPLPEKPE